MSESGEKIRRLRARLFHLQHGLCFWCGTPMRLLVIVGGKCKEHPNDMCTIDHLEPRWHPMRGKFDGQLRKVAACYKCNNERDRQQLMLIPQELLNEAAGNGGRKAIELAKEYADLLSPLFPVITGHMREVKVTFEPAQGLTVSIGELVK
jgi:hypothetical protein